MKSNKTDRARGIFYTRDSLGRHEMTPPRYVEWAQSKAKEFGVEFDGTPVAIEKMIRDGRCVDRDLYLDYGVKGNELSREGLNSLIVTATTDESVTHCFVPRRDRLARPDDPLDAMKIESLLTKSGVTLVFFDTIVPARSIGSRPDIKEMLTALIDYHRAGEDRRELARKMIEAQIQLAQDGFSTGGTPPFGFRRWLVCPDGSPIRELMKGERVKMPGHHVVWLPTADHELAVVRRIIEMLEKNPANQVAKILTAEGIPSPYAGRTRKDNGIRHVIRGIWHPNTVTGIARNKLLVATATYGKWSFGDQLRYSREGPRELTHEDFCGGDRTKVVRNNDADLITASANFEPIIDPGRHTKLVEELDRRGASQRGKPRATSPDNNPLGCRIYDWSCGWPLYRATYNGSYRYVCGLYGQSSRTQCSHNWIKGPEAARFVLGCIRQRFSKRGLRHCLENRLREFARSEQNQAPIRDEHDSINAELTQLETNLETAARNMTLANSPEKFRLMEKCYDELASRKKLLEEKASEQKPSAVDPQQIESEIEKAMTLFDRIEDLVNIANGKSAAAEVIKQLNVRMFLRFEPRLWKKRKVNKLVGGQVTFGNTPPPINIYEGPTARTKISGSPGRRSKKHDSTYVNGEEGESCGNRN